MASRTPRRLTVVFTALLLWAPPAFAGDSEPPVEDETVFNSAIGREVLDLLTVLQLPKMPLSNRLETIERITAQAPYLAPVMKVKTAGVFRGIVDSPAEPLALRQKCVSAIVSLGIEEDNARAQLSTFFQGTSLGTSIRNPPELREDTVSPMVLFATPGRDGEIVETLITLARRHDSLSLRLAALGAFRGYAIADPAARQTAILALDTIGQNRSEDEAIRSAAIGAFSSLVTGGNADWAAAQLLSIVGDSGSPQAVRRSALSAINSVPMDNDVRKEFVYPVFAGLIEDGTEIETLRVAAGRGVPFFVTVGTKAQAAAMLRGRCQDRSFRTPAGLKSACCDSLEGIADIGAPVEEEPEPTRAD